MTSNEHSRHAGSHAGQEAAAIHTAEDDAGASSSLQPSTSCAAASSSSTARAPPPKKRKSTLGAKVAKIKPKETRLNTLELSKRDWDEYKSSASAPDSAQQDQASDTLTLEERAAMDAQTHGGASARAGGGGRGGTMAGYLDRVDFLDRVHGRVQQAAEETRRRAAAAAARKPD